MLHRHFMFLHGQKYTMNTFLWPQMYWGYFAAFILFFGGVALGGGLLAGVELGSPGERLRRTPPQMYCSRKKVLSSHVESWTFVLFFVQTEVR